MTTSPVMTITDELLGDLEKKAKACIEDGDWYTFENICAFPDSAADEPYVIAANPATILALVEHIRSLSELLEKVDTVKVRKELLEYVARTLERTANDVLDGRNAADALRGLLAGGDKP